MKPPKLKSRKNLKKKWFHLEIGQLAFFTGPYCLMFAVTIMAQGGLPY
jgi:hypothetical protein